MDFRERPPAGVGARCILSGEESIHGADGGGGWGWSWLERGRLSSPHIKAALLSGDVKDTQG